MGALLRWGRRLETGGRGGPRTALAGVLEAEPGPRLLVRGSRARGRFPDPTPLPGARFPSPGPISRSLGTAGAWERQAGLGGAGDPLGSLGSRGNERFAPNPELAQPFAWGRPQGGRGCYLGCRRMSEGRATTSCPPRPSEQKPDLLGSC